MKKNNPGTDQQEKFILENDINTYIHKISQQNKLNRIESNADNYLKYFLNNKNKNGCCYSPYIPKQKRCQTYRDNYHYSEQNQDANNTNNENVQDSTLNEGQNHLSRQSRLMQDTGKTLAKSFSELNTQLSKKSRLNDITNPDLFYKIANGDYQRYKLQQKQFLDYNYEAMQKRQGIKREVDVNPFNPNICSELGDTSLVHNTILNPLPNYTYNKYLEKQLMALEKLEH